MDAGSTVPFDAGSDATTDDSGIFVRPDSTDAGDAGDGAAVCDLTKTPDQESCLVDNQYGVFVAMPDSGGIADASCGSHTAPCATVAEAITAANSGGKSRIFLCQGAFNEAVTLTTHQSLYGGFACPTDGGAWTFADAGTQLTSPTNQIALTINGVTGSLDVDDLWITAPDASGTDDAGNGMSSIAVFVNGSTVTFRRCVITAGNGDKGADGVTTSNYNGSSAASGQAPVLEAGTGGEGGLQACLDGITQSTGGRGGDSSGVSGIAGGDGGNGSASPMPVTSAGFDGVGGAGGTVACPMNANPGASGQAAAGPATAAGAVGTLAIGGWLPSSGNAGGRGNPGQGGGGGGGTALVGAGGGGGAGGCGGGGGSGGHGGGGAIAVVCLSASSSFQDCILRTGMGGLGGNGGDGQPGQSGGGPGLATCSGSFGGPGAGGSGGAGGTGGISICVLTKSSTIVGVSNCALGDAGGGGAGGQGQPGGSLPTSGNAGFDGGGGLAGIVQEILQIQ